MAAFMVEKSPPKARENAPCVAEYSEQVHGAFHADARGHLQGDILDGHNRKMSFIIL